MSIIKIEMLSNKELHIGQKLNGVFIEDKMYYDSLPKYDKYIIRLFDKDSNSCGFASRESLFSKNSPKDIIQAIYDLEMDFNKSIEFEVINTEDISKNKKKLFTLKLLDSKITAKILGLTSSKKAELSIDKYLDKYLDKYEDKVCNFSQDNNINTKEVTLNVKGDAKSNPRRTVVTRLIKNLETPDLELTLDDNSKLRVRYDGEYAGEVLDSPTDLHISNVISVKCKSNIPLGYTIVVKYNPVDIMENSSYKHIQEVNALEKNTEINLLDKTNSSTSKKFFRADKNELLKIVEYMNKLCIPESLIDKVLETHEPFEEKYLKRIPHSSDESFTPWVMSEGDRNLLLLAIVQIEEGFNLRLVGGKGTGKNTFLETLSWIYQRPMFTQSASSDIDTSILIGDKNLEHKIVNNTVVQDIGFETGLLIEAMEVGGFFEFGEGNSCRPGVLMSLHTILDNRKFMDIKGYKLVQANPRFSFILTMNVDYEGCNELNQGFRDRFATIKFPPPKEIKTILKHTCKFASEENIDICNRVYKNILGLSSELQSEEVVTIRGYIRTLQMAKYVPIEEALECCITDNVSDDILISRRIKHIIENITG